MRGLFLSILFFLAACSNSVSPVKNTPETEYSYNYWLLQGVYLYEDELSNLPEEGDSVQVLYDVLKDPYTTYTPPSKSDGFAQQIETSIVKGDIGLRYFNLIGQDHPLFITRVYSKGPAGRANVPKYGNIISVNDVEITGENAKITYDSILQANNDINLRVAYNGEVYLYELKKETFYAPTVFVDTLFDDSARGYPGIVFVTIEIFTNGRNT